MESSRCVLRQVSAAVAGVQQAGWAGAADWLAGFQQPASPTQVLLHVLKAPHFTFL